MLTSQLEVLGRFGLLPGELVMVGYLTGLGTELAPTHGTTREGFGDPTVQQPAPRQAGQLIHEVFETLVSEVVGRLAVAIGPRYFTDQAAGHQVFKGRYCLFVAAAAGVTENVEAAGATDGGGSAEQLPAGLTGRSQPGLKQVAHPRGDLPLPSVSLLRDSGHR